MNSLIFKIGMTIVMLAGISLAVMEYVTDGLVPAVIVLAVLCVSVLSMFVSIMALKDRGTL
jgi:hypothetical protein